MRKTSKKSVLEPSKVLILVMMVIIGALFFQTGSESPEVKRFFASMTE